MTIKPGDRIVARGLPVNKASKSNKLPPSIALVVRVTTDGVVIRLRIGGFGSSARFHPRSRPCPLEQVVRLASTREVVTGELTETIP